MAELLILAVLVEAVTELVKDIHRKGLSPHQLVALALGQVLAWGAGINVFDMVGVEGEDWMNYVGKTLSGLIMSRGANYVHKVWDRISSRRA